MACRLSDCEAMWVWDAVISSLDGVLAKALPLFEHRRDPTVVGPKLTMDRWAVDHLQSLRQVGFRRSFALTGHFSLWLTKHFQEVIVDRGIGQFAGPCAKRHPRKLFWDICDCANPIQQLLCGEQSRVGV